MKTLITALLLLFCLYTNAQKKGYKELQIGANLDSIYSLNHYKILVSNEKNEYLIKPDGLKICNSDIEGITIQTDDNRIINFVQLFTNAVNYQSWDDWFNHLTNTAKMIVSTVGKSTYENKGGDKFLLSWVFNDEKTILVFYSNQVSSFETNFQRSYVFIWARNDDASNNKMW